MATTTFRGRNYTAWFTIDIPVDHGPWKLRGLPGLILDVLDESGRYRFRATQIDLKPKKVIIAEKLKKPKTKNLNGFEVYKNAIINAFDDQMAIARARMPKGARLRVKGPDCENCPDPKNYTQELFD